MKVKENIAKSGGIFLPMENKSISAEQLAEMPRFHCKKYSLWSKFEMSEAERKEIENASISQCIAKDKEELAKKEAQLLEAISLASKPKKEKVKEEPKNELE